MIEDLIYKAISQIPLIAQQAAQYNHKAGVFYQQIPNDKDSLWNTPLMFPRVVYHTDWRYNGERKTDGNLYVDVYCLNESTVAPEDFAKSIMDSLDNLFLTKDGNTYCLLWMRSNHFEVTGKEPLVLGTTISFDIIAFPKQTNVIPSPVWGLNRFIKEMQPDCKIIGYDTIPEVLRASSDSPLIYVRMTNTKNVRTSYAMAWQSADIRIHVIAPAIFDANGWVQAILRDLSIERECLMQNDAPFLIFTISQGSQSNPIQEGQISLSGQYGILRKLKDDSKLNYAIFSQQ